MVTETGCRLVMSIRQQRSRGRGNESPEIMAQKMQPGFFFFIFLRRCTKWRVSYANASCHVYSFVRGMPAQRAPANGGERGMRCAMPPSAACFPLCPYAMVPVVRRRRQRYMESHAAVREFFRRPYRPLSFLSNGGMEPVREKQW